MSCIGITKCNGFSLVELMAVVAIIALLSAIAGRTLTDQLNQQKVADAINRARFIASILSPIHEQLTDSSVCGFYDGYKAKLSKFISDMNTTNCQPIESALLGGVELNEDALGQSVGSAYQVTIAKHSIFASFSVDNSNHNYGNIDFYATQKIVDNNNSTVTWTVTDFPIGFSASELTRLSNINNTP